MNMEQALARAARGTQRATLATRTLSLPAAESSGLDEMSQRERTNRQGCEALCDAIEDLIVRTSKTLAIPAEFKARPLAFTRAYLGINP